ncbi:thioredoxin [archaeon]|nr:thioredoxin [archaeon]
MTVKLEVFTSPTCPHCPHAVKVAKEVREEKPYIHIIETSTGTNDGMKRARHYSIMAVPTILVTGAESEQPIGLKGVPSKTSLIKAIDVAEGNSKFIEPKQTTPTFSGLIERVKSFFIN